jgi:uncharacterized protein YjiK
MRSRTPARWLYALLAVVPARTAAQDEAWLPRYDLESAGATSISLPRVLGEISGLAFDAHGRMLAHDDESGTLYVIDPSGGEIAGAFEIGPRGLRGDFEGVAAVGNRIFLATSGGTLIETSFPIDLKRAPLVRTITTGLDRVCEVEGLAWDAAASALLLPCKTSRERQAEDRLRVYAVSLATLALRPQPLLDVPHAALRAAGLPATFHPSAIEVHPRSGNYFLLAAQEEAIVEIARDGRVLAARRLDARVHAQPEGIAFGPDLALWIAGEGERGTLSRYRLLPTGEIGGSGR